MTPRLGGLYPGTGLLLDMGRVVTITTARIDFGSDRGADFQFRVGAAPALADLPTVASEAYAGGVVRVRLSTPAHGRYLLIWFTRLPPNSAGTFQVSVWDLYKKAVTSSWPRWAILCRAHDPQITLTVAGPQAAAASGCPCSPMALEPGHHYRDHPALAASPRLTSRPELGDQEGDNPGPVEPRPPGATAGLVGTATPETSTGNNERAGPPPRITLITKDAG